MEEVSAFQIIIWIVLISLGIGFLRKIYPGIKKFIEHTEALAALPEIKKSVEEIRQTTLPAMTETLDRVHHEVFPNSGGSLRDSINRNEVMTKNIDKTVQSLVQKVEPITGEIKVFRKEFDDHVDESIIIVREIKEITDGKRNPDG